MALEGAADGPLTLMIRPEHVMLAGNAPDALELEATVDQLVFFGTDTHVHLGLADGASSWRAYRTPCTAPEPQRRRAHPDCAAAKALRIVKDEEIAA